MIGIIKSKSHMIGKLFVYQIAMSLLGLFVVSPFSGVMQIAAGVFSTLFYFALVAYAVIEDGQKDYVSVTAGRLDGRGYTGFVYALVSYLPTIVIVVANVLVSLFTNAFALRDILKIIVRFFLMGMYLGIDTGLAQRTQDPITHEMVSGAPDWLLFLSENSVTFAILLVVMPIVCGLSYYLAYKGKIHVDTTVKKK